MVKSSLPIPPCTQFRYFEIEVLENKTGADIIFGIIEENDQFDYAIDRADILQNNPET